MKKLQVLEGRLSGKVGSEPGHCVEGEKEVDENPDPFTRFLLHREDVAKLQDLLGINNAHHVPRL